MGLYINGNEYSHASAEVDFNGKVYVGVTSIKYDDELTREGVWGTAPEQLGVTQGELKQNAEFTFLLSEWYRLLDNLPDGYGNVRGNISISYREPRKRVKIDTLKSCYIVKPGNASDQGPGASKVTVGLHVAEPIERNGKRLIIPKTQRLRVGISVSASVGGNFGI